MNCPVIKLNTNKKLALLAAILGILAFIIGNPNNKNKITVNAKELALSTIKNEDKISVIELADWIIKGKEDFVLVDLRDEKSYNEYTIPNSVNIEIENLLDSDLMRNEKIILYGDDDITSAQAWFILKSANYKSVYILKGGMNAWKNEILYPKIADNATPEEKSEFEKVKQISFYFGGMPQIISGTTASSIIQNVQAPSIPKISAPPAGNLKSATKKKREGC
ncbi:MAG: rhodanese-like domain-containing protein [Melioribacter sp.]|uniref:rhodanese-like domain-containing protein n=1 Tax=Rosettibacter primus TaxID=3111523 RepID=UPI00247F095F|nr:rhodanese-like domain-containing protein [Melioribacter sp.]